MDASLILFINPIISIKMDWENDGKIDTDFEKVAVLDSIVVAELEHPTDDWTVTI